MSTYCMIAVLPLVNKKGRLIVSRFHPDRCESKKRPCSVLIIEFLIG
jgi:hypothetical protein